jgi:hypothetical protein
MTLNSAVIIIKSQQKNGIITPIAVKEAIKIKKMTKEQKDSVLRFARSVLSWNRIHS